MDWLEGLRLSTICPDQQGAQEGPRGGFPAMMISDTSINVSGLPDTVANSQQPALANNIH